MKKLLGLKSPRGTSWLLAALATSLSALVAHATPYATELSNYTGIVYFTLNESADNVKIIYGTTTNVIGPLAAGSYTTNVGAASPFVVEVTKDGGTGYKTATAPNVAGKLQISNDPTLARFNSPRGLAINRNPASPFFGRIYVANSAAGTVGGRTLLSKGFYTIKADFSDSPNAYGNTGQTNGLPYASASANSPLRISIGDDDFIYPADYADASSLVARLNGNLTGGELVLDYIGGPGTILAPTNHGSTMKVVTTGSLGTGNLKVYTVDEDYTGPANADAKLSLWRYDVDGGPLTNQITPVKVLTAFWSGAGPLTDFVIGPNGYFYVLQNRAVAASTGRALTVYDASGVELTNSLAMWGGINANPAITADVLTNCWSLAITADGKYLGIVQAGGITPSDTWIIPLINGIPDLANRRLLDTGTVSQGRAIDFDLAGNLYTTSSGDGVVRAFSPGGPSVATTTSSGTFSLTVPETVVSISTVDLTAAEPNTPGTFTLTRIGDLGVPLTVGYAISGTASNGEDYQTLAQTVTFAIGATATNITIIPIDDFQAEPVETVTLIISNSPTYSLTTGAATMVILDDETPAIDITTVRNSVYERSVNDYARFRLSRLGRTNDSVNVDLNYGGTATSGVDFTPTPTVTLGEGVLTATFDVTPLDDTDVEGTELIQVTVANGPGYVPGTNNVMGTANLVDDDVVDQIVLFADDFTVPDNATNWSVFFASTNSANPDYVFNYGFDYGSLGIDAAPHSVDGETRGVQMYVNKSGGGAAAVNLYLTNQVFTGDYAVRFDMFLVQGTTATTEYALFGINHSATMTNWFRNSTASFTGVPPGWTFDGLFYGVESDGAALGDYALYSSPTTSGSNPTPLASRNASTLSDVFKAPPWAVVGAPANLLTSVTPTWADVEISQVGSLVSLKINNSLIFSYTNQTAYTGGHIMLGYCDAYDSLSSASAQVIFDNLRVVKTAALNITSIKVEGGQVKIGFTWPVSEPTTAFELLSSPTADAGYTVDNGATFSVVVPGNSYEVTTPVNAGARFYKIHRL